MNKKYENIFIISVLTGGMAGLLSLIPYFARYSVIILLTIISIFLIFLFEKRELINISNEKESLKVGALTGVFSTTGFLIIFCPLIYILSLFFSLEYLGGFTLMIRLMSLPLAVMVIVFICIISAIFNAFSALMYYYIKESIKKLK